MFEKSARQGIKALLCLFAALALVSCATTPASVEQPVKSPNDDYRYRLLTLDNDLEVLLISDPDTPKAAAALDVMVGSGDNPPGLGGLAHFLEHMLFLGTDKYPDAAEYGQFIAEHGGSHNAFTSFEHTNYFFEINNASLPEALDRFAQFFIAPRFDLQYVDREKNAVQAEYQMGLKSDGRRGLDVLQEVMNQDHPYSQFSVGSLESLADRPDAPIRDELIQFYDTHYSANVMRLVVFGAQSLDELQSLVVPVFSKVPNRAFEHTTIDAPLFAEGSLPMFVEVQPLATQRQLEVSFPTRDYRAQYRIKPEVYLGNLVGHEGEGSLLSRLKAEGLAESLAAGAGLGWRGGELFSVSISLTEKGAADPDRVLQLFFGYIDMLRQEGPQGWLYDEQSRVAELAFRYREPGNPMGYVSGLATHMHNYSPRDTLRGPYLMDSYDEPILVELLGQIRPDNALVVLSDKDVTGDRVSQQYQVPYSSRALELERVITLGAPEAAALHLPLPNEFIAEDVSLVELTAQLPKVPQIALQEGRQTIWFMPDDEFRVPKAVTYINFRSPEVGQNVTQAVMAALYTTLLTDTVNELSYPAQLAGLSFDFYKHAQGISLRVGGYNDKQAILLQRLLQDMLSPSFSQQRFDNIRSDMIRSLKNSVTRRPSSQAMQDLTEAVVYGEWGEQAMIAALEKTDLAELEAYIGRFWATATAEALIYGNYDAAAVSRLSGMLSTVVLDKPAPVLPELRVLKLAAGESLQYSVDVPHDDSVVAWYLQGADDTFKDRAATALTAQIMKSGFFQQLRTEQQLGYVVSAFAWSKLDVPALVMLIQSPVADANVVAGAMQEFMLQVQSELDAAQFERHKTALVSDILRPDKNLRERAEYYWQSIARKQWDFAGRQMLADAVEALTLEQWEAYYQEVFLKQRHSLQVVAPGRWGIVPEGKYRRYGSAEAIRRGHESYLVE